MVPQMVILLAILLTMITFSTRTCIEIKSSNYIMPCYLVLFFNVVNNSD